MKDGKIVERGLADAIFQAPQTDYARTLLAAALHTSRPRVLDFTKTLEAPP
jgi:ABC-type microcin C transport system duplicated ATPase subunit YejF